MRTITRKNLLLLMLMPVLATAQVTIGSGDNPNLGALLDLKQFSVSDPLSDGVSTSLKGIAPPRVALQDIQKLEPCAPTTLANRNSHIGLTVYNTTYKKDQLAPAYYYWDGNKWLKLATPATLNRINIKNEVTTEVGTSLGGGALADFGTIIIQEDGSYSFCFRIFAQIERESVIDRNCTYYVSVWADGILKDIVEMLVYVPSTGKRPFGFTYTANLACTLAKGQNITFRWAYYSNPLNPDASTSSPPATLLKQVEEIRANQTSLIWWKL